MSLSLSLSPSLALAHDSAELPSCIPGRQIMVFYKIRDYDNDEGIPWLECGRSPMLVYSLPRMPDAPDSAVICKCFSNQFISSTLSSLKPYTSLPFKLHRSTLHDSQAEAVIGAVSDHD